MNRGDTGYSGQTMKENEEETKEAGEEEARGQQRRGGPRFINVQRV